MKDTTAV